jgi:hydrogenase maturation protein HypF
MWLEHLAQTTDTSRAYPFPLNDRLLDFRPLLAAVVEDRLSGRTVSEIARAFHISVAVGLSDAVKGICRDRDVNIAVLSGGVFQNELLLAKVKTLLDAAHIEIWTNAAVPPNDGGISLGQAALAAFGHGGVSNA